MANAIDRNIAELFDFAEKAVANARAAEGRLTAHIPNIQGGELNYTLEKPAMDKPAALSDLLAPDETDATLRWLDNESEKWLDKFFPEIQSCLKHTPEEWLCGIITGQKPFGLSREVFEAVWHDSRDREYRARNAAVRQINQEFSARGFSLPPGAQIAALVELEKRAADAISDVNRAQTIKDADIKLDLLKFAEEQAIRLKMGVLQAMADFYRQWIELPNKALEASRIRTQAYASFQDALSTHWRVQLGFEELRLRAEDLRMNGKLNRSRLEVGANSFDSRNSALAQAVRAYGDIASSAASAASTLTAQITTGGA